MVTHPLSPFIFNLSIDCLAKMEHMSKANCLFTGLAHRLVDRGVVILQYADDTIFSISDGMEAARNLKLLLYLFEAMSRLKINFQKN